jgi:CBS-domain-containing membrane protein
VQTVRDGLCPGEAAALAHEGRFRHVPVVDPAGRVVGLLSIRDLLSGYAAELEVKNSELLACLSADGAGGD